MECLTLVDENIYRYPTSRGDRYMVRLTYKDREYRRRGLPSFADAVAYRDKLRGQIVERRFFPERRPDLPTLTAYAKTWLAACELRGLKRNTLRSYRQNLSDHLLPALGAKRLNEIARDDLKTLLLKKKRDGLSPHSLRLILAPLSKLYSDALDDGLVLMNPFLHPGRIINLRTRHREIRPFSDDEIRAIFAIARAHVPGHVAFLLTLFETGARIGEVSALTISDVDLADRQIAIEKNFTNGHLEASSKNARRRRVEISDALVPVLAAHLERLDLAAHARAQSPPVLLFPTPTGKYLDAKNWRFRVWYPLLDRAQIPRRPPHQIRHTFATRRLREGYDLLWVRDQLGHSSIAVTADLYAHLVRSDHALRKHKGPTGPYSPPGLA